MSTTNRIADSLSVSAAITEAFDAVWSTLYVQVAPENTQADELKIALSQTLIALASEGITDPQELRRKALENMAFTIR